MRKRLTAFLASLKAKILPLVHELRTRVGTLACFVQAWVVERFSLWETGSTDGVKVREVALETGDRMAQIRDRLESLNAELIRLQDELAAAGPFHVNIGKLQADIQAVEQERTKAVLQEAACDAARQAEFDQLAEEIRLAKQRRKNSVLLAGSIAWLLCLPCGVVAATIGAAVVGLGVAIALAADSSGLQWLTPVILVAAVAISWIAAAAVVVLV